VVALAFLGQQPSNAIVDGAFAGFEHIRVHAIALPVVLSSVHGSPSSHDVAQLPSHVSPESTWPSPQRGAGGAQSLSLLFMQPGAQQPSPLLQVVIGALTHLAVHVAAAPVSMSVVQTLLSSHELGQLPSQVSPGSTTPLPHFGPDVPAAPPDTPAVMTVEPPCGLVPLPAAALLPDAAFPAFDAPALPAFDALAFPAAALLPDTPTPAVCALFPWVPDAPAEPAKSPLEPEGRPLVPADDGVPATEPVTPPADGLETSCDPAASPVPASTALFASLCLQTFPAATVPGGHVPPQPI
jgi:hypothetical protein